VLFLMGLSLSGCSPRESTLPDAPSTAADASQSAPATPQLLRHVHQLTFAGARTGEGYFSADGTKIVFQSEREEGNPFYQIYVFDRCTGETKRVSPGHGKTTCAWFHPDGSKVLFASTHEDPQSLALQAEEIAFRASGQTRRYSWDYDEHYELYAHELFSGHLTKLTSSRGYDAEGAYSPAGDTIVFASNRTAYEESLSPEQADRLAKDPAYFMEIYRMNADGSNVTRLTNAPGYDGGPFFSADGSKITWRRFAPNGATAEIFVMNADGSDQRAVTSLDAMSWAPFFHPSGDYIVFATNLHGFDNFELYLVRADGGGTPVRVTESAGFDGLPVFSPDGASLLWTSNRGSAKQSQLYRADWDDAVARTLLGLAPPKSPIAPTAEKLCGAPPVDLQQLRTRVGVLAGPEMQGRRTGTSGELLAVELAAEALAELGLEPAGDNGTYFQTFEFTSGVSLGEGNILTLRHNDADESFAPGEEWLPLSFTETGTVPATGVAFAGYGIVAPELARENEPSVAAYDAYVHLDVKDKWVAVLDGLPLDVPTDVHAHLARYSGLRYKAMVARDKGARGLLLLHGPRSPSKRELIPLTFDTTQAKTSLAGITLSTALGEKLFASSPRSLEQLQQELDTGKPMMGFTLEDLSVAATLDLLEQHSTGKNVLARLPAEARYRYRANTVIVGAHIDHLGVGKHPGSLATAEDTAQIHFGADDNASGVAAALAIAEQVQQRIRSGRLAPTNDLLIALWSGEEIGLLGSSHYVNTLPESEASRITAYLNLDMVGRLEQSLVLQGIGSSPDWHSLLERANAPVGLSLSLQNESYLPTDATSFYLKRIPILSGFTGAHRDYHTPRDTPEKLNYPGLASIAHLFTNVAAGLLEREDKLAYREMERPEHLGRRANLRAYFGTIPDYVESDLKGVKLAGVAQGGPAQQAGLQAGDIVLGVGEKQIENIYDYTYALEGLKIGEPVSVRLRRGEEVITLDVTPGSRD
ncbi:MAG: M28 family peptidase, partial [Bdellovibrionales bacterium]|nr:M28 family peptidase [Bdellovibrionales bacterium]